MPKYTVPPGEAWHLGRGPFIFSGQPPILTGELEVINRSEEKVKVKAIATTAGEGFGEVRLMARLAPKDRARFPSHVLVDPYLAPGTYTAELDCGEQREKVVAHVFEKRAIEITPQPVQLTGAGGEALSQLLVVRNHGNVPHTLPDLALVFLEERDWIGRSLVYALRETGEEERHQDYLDRLLCEVRKTMARPARVTFTAEGAEILPGETREVTLGITLPEELIKSRTYIGSTPLLGDRLFFDVKCNGAAHSTQRRPQ